VPGLAVVIVGERKDSQTYVRMKRKACEEVGVASFGADLPATATQQEVLDVVQQLNANPDVHGILVQLPVSSFHRGWTGYSCYRPCAPHTVPIISTND
jgi:5,10-methylene-tetrahydrofolate dehydrogenase/methenyl tetrahydrofolate cyclohydrolase